MTYSATRLGSRGHRQVGRGPTTRSYRAIQTGKQTSLPPKDPEHPLTLAPIFKDTSEFPQQPNVKWVTVSYTDTAELVKAFQGVEVVLNFIVVNTDPENKIGKLIVDASVEAGVKRFAPSEWAMLVLPHCSRTRP